MVTYHYTIAVSATRCVYYRVMLGLYLGMADFDLGETLSEAYSSEVASPTSDAPPSIAPYPHRHPPVHSHPNYICGPSRLPPPPKLIPKQ